MTEQIRQVDHAQARAFLAALAPDGQLTFQTFPDAKYGGIKSARPAILHGAYDDVANQLEDLNHQGHGVFLMVNQGDQKGRSTANVVRVRAYFLDLDGAPLDPVAETAAPPEIVVESSPQRWHAYWRADDCALEDFKARQRALADKFNGDPKVCDLPRVMRVPGFWHLKAEPFRSRLINPRFNA